MNQKWIETLRLFLVFQKNIKPVDMSQDKKNSLIKLTNFLTKSNFFNKKLNNYKTMWMRVYYINQCPEINIDRKNITAGSLPSQQ